MIDQTAATFALSPQAKTARWQDYVRLLKPRIMSLVVFTAVTGLICAPPPRTGAALNPVLAAVAVLCIAVGAGASGALNMWYDADVDALMRRTRGRPIPAGRVQGADALTLGVTLSLFSVALMGLAVNWLAASLLAFTILFYAVVYTIWLKRRTPQNIVIGGFAGALPPLVGWVAVSGSASLNAWLLVAIIFFWTPPHFWSLSLYNSQDYARAGIPMMPVVKGAASTRRQILAYSLALVPLCLGPVFTGLGGRIYLAAAAAGGAIFLALAIRLALSRAGESSVGASTQATRMANAPARDLFAFSIFYLFLLFAALLGEHLAGLAPLTLRP
ncbi:MAG: heme o synthase [Caulobacteraceae bacterium]